MKLPGRETRETAQIGHEKSHNDSTVFRVKFQNFIRIIWICLEIVGKSLHVLLVLFQIK